jgi:aspartate aminotransferase-like enzyme
METAITNLSRSRILCLVGGAFGARFQKIAERCGRPADTLPVPWGTPHTPAILRDALDSSPGAYDLVTVVHSETSTGVLNPVAELAAVVREHEDILIAVDGVTSVGGVRVEFDAWELDFLLTGSQKALALPPGLALAAASQRALERAEEIPARSYYFDLLEFERRAPEFQTTNTPAVNLFFALDAQLERITHEGLEERWARHQAMAERTWAWVEDLGDRTGRDFSVLAPEGYRSPTVTAVTLPEGLSGPDIVAAAGARGFTLAPGYGKLKPSTIRIGHMGDHTMAELEAILAVLDEADWNERSTQSDTGGFTCHGGRGDSRGRRPAPGGGLLGPQPGGAGAGSGGRRRADRAQRDAGGRGAVRCGGESQGRGPRGCRPGQHRP